MGRLGVLLIFVALALGAYNAWSLSRMQQEMDSLQKQVKAIRVQSAKARPFHEEQPRMVRDLIVSAQKHSLKAKEFLRQGQVGKAGAELNKSIEELKAASEMARSRSGSALEDINKTIGSLKETAEGLWKRFGGTGEKP